MSYRWIATQNDLNDLISRLQPLEWVVIDTEADSFHHFQEKLCLVQLLTPQGVELIDPLVKLDFSSFWSVLGDKKWKIHAADYDLRLIRKVGGKTPPEIFDTFIAAQVLGKKTLSYSALVLEYKGITLSKSNQKADWTLRPLNESMLDYAAADVLHLDPIVLSLKGELEQLGRTAWFNQSCQRQMRVTMVPEAEEEDPDAWQVSGHHQLDPHSRTILKHLWQWRHEEAATRDLAPFRVLRNDLMISLVERFSKNPKAEFPIPPFIKGESKQRLINKIEAAIEAEPIPFIHTRRPDPMSLAVEKRFNAFREKRQKVSEDLGMDPGFIASKAVLIELAENPESAPEKLMKEDRCCQWQMDLMTS
ncbi:MAG: HRDC domain-containing protein [Verrucomicrobiota bacterium]